MIDSRIGPNLNDNLNDSLKRRVLNQFKHRREELLQLVVHLKGEGTSPPPPGSSRKATAKKKPGSVDASTSANGQPPTRIIPASVRRTMDFQNPLDPVS